MGGVEKAHKKGEAGGERILKGSRHAKQESSRPSLEPIDITFPKSLTSVSPKETL
jgi:hypothetical protein